MRAFQQGTSMARLPRLSLPNIPQHVIQRGNNRHACFFSDQDYTVYLSKLKQYSQQYKVAVHSYILMTNHVHLLLTPEEGDGVSRLIQSLGRYYVRYINQTHDRTGTLWEGRYRSTLVDNETYFLIVSRYIELNPVRARMVDHPVEYPWSSYQRNAIGKPVQLVTSHPCYQSLGETDEERQLAYKALFDQQIPDYTLKEIRDAINKSWVLGNDQFKKQRELQAGRRLSPKVRGGDRKSADYKASH